MEELKNKFEELAKKYQDYEAEICEGICALERAAYGAVEKGQKSLEEAESHLTEIDNLITEAFSLHPLSDEVQARFTQCLVSYRPRLDSFITQLKELIANPPTESTYPKIDDREIFGFAGGEKDEENNDTNENNNQNNENNETNETNESNETNENNENNEIDKERVPEGEIENKQNQEQNSISTKDQPQTELPLPEGCDSNDGKQNELDKDG